MKRLLATLLLASALTGCAALHAVVPILADVIAAVTDAAQIVDAIEKFVDEYFARHPDAAKQEQVAKALAKTRATLNLALRASRGAEELDQQKVDAAFADFRVAYQELMVLVGPLGVRPAGALAAQPYDGHLYVPKPMALDLKVRE